MAKSESKIQDSISVEVNGEQTTEGVKGPAKDRLENHKAEVAAFAKRLKRMQAEQDKDDDS